MFPIPFNFPFIKKNGERTTIGDAIDASGSDPYVLPVASDTTLGGVKIGNGINIAEDGTISVTAVRISPFNANAEEVTS